MYKSNKTTIEGQVYFSTLGVKHTQKIIQHGALVVKKYVRSYTSHKPPHEIKLMSGRSSVYICDTLLPLRSPTVSALFCFSIFDTALL